MAPIITEADRRAYLVDPWTGVVSKVKSVAERAQAAAEGLVQATPADIAQEKRRQEYDKPGLALLAGALRGGTFGLSDLAMVQSGAVEAETLRGLQEFSPIYSGAGDVAGSVATLFAGPGSLLLKGAGKAGAATARGIAEAGSAARQVGRGALAATRGAAHPLAAGAAARAEMSTLARLSQPAEAGLLSDLAGTAVREGIVGGAIGAGQATSDIALSPEELSSAQVLEKLADGTKSGAMVFAGLGTGMRVVGRGAKAAQKYFGRGLEDLEASQKSLKVLQADLRAAEAITGDPAAVSMARSELRAAQEGVGVSEQALATARMEEAAGLGAQGTIKAKNALKAAQERTIVAAERAEVAALAPDMSAIGRAKELILAGEQRLATSEATFANRVTGRAVGLGLAYYMGGGVGMQALGFFMGPRMMKYVNRIAGRMKGPIGGVVRDVQDAFKPEIIQYAKWPLERAVGGFAVGGPAGAAVQLGLGRLEETTGGAAIMSAVESVFPRAAQKGGLGISEWASTLAGKAQSKGTGILANTEDWTDEKARALAGIDLTRMEAGLLSSLNPDIPNMVAQEAVSKVTDIMAYLQEVNPANIYQEGKIPRAAAAKFKAKLSTVVDPEVFLKALAEGRLSPGSPEVEAMRRAYPGAMQQLQGIFQAAVTKTYALGGTVERKYLKNLQAIGVKVSTPKQYNPARERYLLSLVEPTQPGPKPRPRPITGAAKASATQSQRLQRGQ